VARDDARGYRLALDVDERALLDLARPGSPAVPDPAPDWESVGAMAHIHRLEARLHRAVEALGSSEGPPGPVADAWRTAYFASLHRNVSRLDQRDRAVRQLAEGGIRVMVVKGAALADTLYTDPAVRPMEDMDFLLPQGSTDRFEELAPGLEAAGIDLLRMEVEEDHHDLTMDGIYRLDYARLWADAEVAPFADGVALVPCLEDQLLLVCISCCRNSFWNLVTLLDAAEILHQHGEKIDWDRAIGRARGLGLETALDTVLALVASLFGEIAPAEARARLVPAPWRRRLIANLLADFRLHEGAGMESVNIRRPIGAFALKYAVNGPGTVARQLRRLVVPNWAWMRAHYPDSGPAGILLHYLAHPFRLLGLGAHLGWDRVLGRRRRG